jgi:hypothetical protein
MIHMNGPNWKVDKRDDLIKKRSDIVDGSVTILNHR